MTRARSKLLVPALIAGSLLTAAPAVAHPGGPPRGPGNPGAGAGRESAAPSRVTARVRRAEQALNRAQERIDDGDAAKAVAQLAAVRRALASASRSALKHVAAGDAAGPASVETILAAEHDVVTGTTDSFDGQDGDVVSALTATLKQSLDARDDAVAAIAALGVSDQAEYGDVLDQGSSQLADELDGIAEALSDDTLTDAAKSALTDAKAQVKATKKDLEARIAVIGDSSSSQEDGGDGGGPGGGGPGPGWFDGP
jgi:DNA-binding FrmR family transcriptional regulator